MVVWSMTSWEGGRKVEGEGECVIKAACLQNFIVA